MPDNEYLTNGISLSDVIAAAVTKQRYACEVMLALLGPGGTQMLTIDQIAEQTTLEPHEIRAGLLYAVRTGKLVALDLNQYFK